MRSILSCLMLLLSSSCLLAKPAPVTFSGEWRIDPQRSMATPTSVLVVTQDSKEVVLEGRTADGRTVATERFAFDGESENRALGQLTKTRTDWSGSTLKMTGTRTMPNGRQATTEKSMKLSNPNELTVTESISTGSTDFKTVNVFVRTK
jgi:hypothetical protein